MCIRFIPVEVVCHADLADIKKTAKTLIDQHFPADESAPSISFAVFYEHRASVKLNRMEVINSIVDEIPQVMLIYLLCCILLPNITARVALLVQLSTSGCMVVFLALGNLAWL